jgi:hypothetical protein
MLAWKSLAVPQAVLELAPVHAALVRMVGLLSMPEPLWIAARVTRQAAGGGRLHPWQVQPPA